MVKEALKKYPEITEIRLGAFYPKEGEKFKAHANWALSRVKFNVKRDISYTTVYHELLHLTQDDQIGRVKTKSGLKKVEREATLLGVARMRSDQIQHNKLPYVIDGGLPQNKIHKYALFAESEKNKGNPNFVADTIKKIKADKKADLVKNPANIKNWKADRYDPILKTKFTKIGKKDFAQGFTEADVRKFMKEYVGKIPKSYLKEEKGWDIAYAYDVDAMIKKPSWMRSKPNKPKSTKSKQQ